MPEHAVRSSAASPKWGFSREVLGSVGSVSVVPGSVDRFGSIDILLRSARLPGPDPPREAPPTRPPAGLVGRF
eukprot:15454467-Alexandrium_andersonii.AAC.1